MMWSAGPHGGRQCAGGRRLRRRRHDGADGTCAMCGRLPARSRATPTRQAESYTLRPTAVGRAPESSAPAAVTDQAVLRSTIAVAVIAEAELRGRLDAQQVAGRAGIGAGVLARHGGAPVDVQPDETARAAACRRCGSYMLASPRVRGEAPGPRPACRRSAGPAWCGRRRRGRSSHRSAAPRWTVDARAAPASRSRASVSG